MQHKPDVTQNHYRLFLWKAAYGYFIAFLKQLLHLPDSFSVVPYIHMWNGDSQFPLCLHLFQPFISSVCLTGEQTHPVWILCDEVYEEDIGCVLPRNNLKESPLPPVPQGCRCSCEHPLSQVKLQTSCAITSAHGEQLISPFFAIHLGVFVQLVSVSVWTCRSR